MIVKTQHCISRDPFFDRYVLSESKPGVVYTVRCVQPGDLWTQYVCDCPAYTYRGHCKHQSIVGDMKLCKWHELIGPEEQTEQQRSDMICPRCGNKTSEEINDDGK